MLLILDVYINIGIDVTFTVLWSLLYFMYLLRLSKFYPWFYFLILFQSHVMILEANIIWEILYQHLTGISSWNLQDISTMGYCVFFHFSCFRCEYTESK